MFRREKIGYSASIESIIRGEHTKRWLFGILVARQGNWHKYVEWNRSMKWTEFQKLPKEDQISDSLSWLRY